MLMTHAAELAIAEMQSSIEGLWRARDNCPESVSMQELLTLQREADSFLCQWAAENGLSSDLPEDREDVLMALRRKNAEVVMGGQRTAEGTAQ